MRFGQVAIIERVGSGGMGAVFRARYPELGIDVAVKVLRSDLPRARFHREAALGMRLRHHQHIARTHHVAEEHGHPYLIIELLDRTWSQCLETAGDLRWPALGRWFLEAARGVAAIHAEHIVHRDIKPSNIMLCPRGTIKITDLGLARSQLEDQPRLESANCGTPQFAAPEQLAGAATDARADVYSLGLSYWALLTRDQINNPWRRKFSSAAQFQELERHAPRRMVRLLRAMTELDPARRPADGAAVAGELTAILAPSPRRTRISLLAALAASTIGIGAALPRATAESDRWQTPLRSVFVLGDGLTAHLAADLADAVREVGLKTVERPLAPLLVEIDPPRPGQFTSGSAVTRGALIAGQILLAATCDADHVHLRTAVVESSELVGSRYLATAEVREQARAMLIATLATLDERGRVLRPAAPGTWVVSLGRWHGARVGERLRVLDATGGTNATGEITRTDDETSLLRLDAGAQVVGQPRVERIVAGRTDSP